MNETERGAANKHLAERLGFRVKRYQVPTMGYRVAYSQYLLVDPQGSRTEHDTEDEAWGCDHLDFYGSLDACAAALPPDVHLMITHEADGLYLCRLWRGGVMVDDPEIEAGWFMDGDSRAEALASALLSMVESEGRREG